MRTKNALKWILRVFEKILKRYLTKWVTSCYDISRTISTDLSIISVITLILSSFIEKIFQQFQVKQY